MEESYREIIMKIKVIFISAVVFFPILTLTISCSHQKAEWKGTIGEENGVTIVKNPKEPMYDEGMISLKEDLSIGVDEGDENYMFSYPFDIDSDSHGNIYVLDFTERTIKKYDNQGVFQKNLGRKGQGPGEFERPYGFCINAQDLIYVADSRKIEVLNSDGIYQKAIRLKNSIEQISINNKNELIIHCSESTQEDEDTRRRMSKIGKYDTQNDKLEYFFSKKKPLFRDIQSEEYRIRIPYERFDTDPKGNVYIGTTNEYEILVYSPDGDLMMRFSREYTPIPIDREIKAKAMKQLSKSGFRINLQEYEKLIDCHPIFGSISTDENDRVWIRLFQLLGEDDVREYTSFDVFSSEGKYLFGVKINRDILGQPVFKNGYVYTLARNESGYSRALRLKIIEH